MRNLPGEGHYRLCGKGWGVSLPNSHVHQEPPAQSQDSDPPCTSIQKSIHHFTQNSRNVREMGTFVEQYVPVMLKLRLVNLRSFEQRFDF